MISWEEINVEIEKINWDAVKAGRIKAIESNKCYYCEEGQPSTRDHIIPKARGNSRVPNDHKTMFCCPDCNHDRGRLWLWEWLEKIMTDKKPRWEIVAQNIKALLR